MERVASTLHTTSEHSVSSITTADTHTSASSSRLNGRPRLFKWTRPFRRKTKSGFCACDITFQLASTTPLFMEHFQRCILFFPLRPDILSLSLAHAHTYTHTHTHTHTHKHTHTMFLTLFGSFYDSILANSEMARILNEDMTLAFA